MARMTIRLPREPKEGGYGSYKPPEHESSDKITPLAAVVPKIWGLSSQIRATNPQLWLLTLDLGQIAPTAPSTTTVIIEKYGLLLYGIELAFAENVTPSEVDESSYLKKVVEGAAENPSLNSRSTV